MKIEGLPEEGKLRQESSQLGEEGLFESGQAGIRGDSRGESRLRRSQQGHAQTGQGQDEPQTAGTSRVTQAGVVAVKASGVQDFKAKFNPHAQGIPSRAKRAGRQIGQAQPRFLLSQIVQDQQGTAQGVSARETSQATMPVVTPTMLG